MQFSSHCCNATLLVFPKKYIKLISSSIPHFCSGRVTLGYIQYILLPPALPSLGLSSCLPPTRLSSRPSHRRLQSHLRVHVFEKAHLLTGMCLLSKLKRRKAFGPGVALIPPPDTGGFLSFGLETFAFHSMLTDTERQLRSQA